MIARIFAEVIRDRYYNCFEKVVFAILDHPKKQTMNKFIYEFERVFNVKKNENRGNYNININNEQFKNNLNDDGNNDPLGKKKFKQYNFIK